VSEGQSDSERIEHNVRRAAGVHALKQIRGLVDEELREDEARRKLLRAYLLYGWIILLLLALALARYFGVI
jgi:hypothetical protein